MEIPESLELELEALSSIYEDNDFSSTVEEAPGSAREFLKLLISLKFGNKFVQLALAVPKTYPDSPPTSKGDAELEEIITTTWTEGCECLFTLLETVRELRGETLTVSTVESVFSMAEDSVDVESVVSEGDEDSEDELDLTIHKGPIVEVNKSKFQAYTAAVASMQQVGAFHEAVVSSKACAKASHNMFAYRFYEGSLARHDYSDDGETAAGGRIAEMLRTMDFVDVDRGIDGVPGQGLAVIVTRWFGGVHLGPSRFKIICNTARDELERLGYLNQAHGGKMKRGGGDGKGK
jgi:hypothetical protein